MKNLSKPMQYALGGVFIGIFIVAVLGLFHIL